MLAVGVMRWPTVRAGDVTMTHTEALNLAKQKCLEYATENTTLATGEPEEVVVDVTAHISDDDLNAAINAAMRDGFHEADTYEKIQRIYFASLCLNELVGRM